MTTTPARHARLGRTARTALFTTAFALCAVPWKASAQIEITTGMGSTAQSFDSLITTGANQTWINDTTLTPGDSTLEGWSLFNSTNAAISTYSAGTGTSTTGTFYSFGADTTTTERALGGLGSGGAYFGSPVAGTVAGYMAFSATNNSPSTLASFTLGYDGEQWRNGGNASTQTMNVEFGFGATFAETTFTPLGAAFGWTSPVVGTVAAAVNGNTAGLVADRGGTVSGLNWATGTTLWIRFVEINDAGNDHGLAIDDFNLSWVAGAPPKVLTWLPTTGDWDTTTPNWADPLNAQTTFTNGDTVNFTDAGIVLQSTVNVVAGGVNSGSVNVSNTSGTYTITGGPISSIMALQKTGAGTLVLGSSFSSGLNATAGTVRTANNEVLGNGSSVVLGDGVTFDLNGNNENVGALDLTGATVTTGAGLLTANGNITVRPSPTGLATTISGNYSTGTSARIIAIEDGVPAEDLVLSANISGSGRVNFDAVGIGGAATVRIAGDNSTHSGGFQLDSGLIYILAGTNPLGTGITFLNGGTIRAAVDLTGANKLNAAASLGGNGVIFEGQNVEFGGDLSFFGNGIKTFSVAEAQTLTFSGLLTSNAGANSAINKTGPGTLIFNENGGAYTGAVSVLGGRVIAASSNALGSGSIMLEATLPDTAILAAITSTSIGALNGGFGDGARVVLGQAAPSADPVVLTINTSVAGDYNGPIETVAGRTSALVKTGSGLQRLAGVNSYTGTTTVSGGTLQFGKKVSLYNNVTSNWTAAKISVASGATLAFNVGGTDEFTAADIQMLASLGTATGGFANGSTLGFDTTMATDAFTYASTIANPNAGANGLGVIKLGSGTLVLSGANTFSGGTTIDGGVLAVNGNAALGAVGGGVALRNGATLQANANLTTNARTVTLGASGGVIDTNGNTVTLDTGSTITGTTLTKIGNGTLTLKGAQTYAVLTASAGTTNINSALGNGTAILIVQPTAETAAVNISGNQKLAALEIASGGVVTLTASAGPLPGESFGEFAVGEPAQAVPEPGAISLLATGLLGLLARRRRV